MKQLGSIVLVVTAIAQLLAPAHLHAGDKDSPEKKAETKKVPQKQETRDIVVDGELIGADLKDKVRTGSACKTYTYKMNEGKSYQIDMRSAAFDSYLRLEDPAGMQVAADDDSGGFPHARIVYRAPRTGDYQIIATSFAGGALGKFTLIVKELAVPAVTNVPAGKPIELKNEKGLATFTGELTAKDSSYKRHKYHKLFLFPMEAGKTYQIDHAIKNGDAYLYLEDPDGMVLAQNDDNGMSLDSRIIHKAGKAGKYRIVATSLSGMDLREFTLTIRQADAAPPEEQKEEKKEKE